MLADSFGDSWNMTAAWVGFGILPHVLGWTALLFVAVVIAVLCRCYPHVGGILFVAFALRAAAALSHVYIVALPDGGADPITFERLAWGWGSNGLVSAVSHFPGINAYFYSWLMSLFYALTERSVLMLQSLSVLAGVLGVYAVWRLGLEVWGEKAAKKAAWVLALFPSVVQYSALPMREAWVVLFFIIGLIGAVRWAKGHGFYAALVGMTAFVVAGFFHTGLMLAIPVFLSIMAARAIRRTLAGSIRGRISAGEVAIILAVICSFFAYFAIGPSFSKLGSPAEIADVDRLIALAHYQNSIEEAGARYPMWTVPKDVGDLLWAVPLRSIYLLFSPFPWDIKNPAHLIGLVDAILYMLIMPFIWLNRQRLVSDSGGRIILLILIPLVIAFGVGTGNFGTGLRHRGKFVAALIILAAPRLPRLLFGAKRAVNGSGVFMSRRATAGK